jgi:hypothetical protein
MTHRAQNVERRGASTFALRAMADRSRPALPPAPRAPRHAFQLALLLSLSAVFGTSAHHSFAPYYFEDESVTIEGVLVSVELKAPHSFIYLVARDKSGVEQRFSGEWASPVRLERNGITKDTLNVGDRLIVTGSPGRVDTEHKIHVKRLERPADGLRWGMRNR